MMTMLTWFVALVAPLSAWAQTDAAASAPTTRTRADITYDSACGSDGVGEVWAGPRKGQVERREGRPGYRVNENGYWSVGCTTPAPPPPPSDCPGDTRPTTWTVGDHKCASPSGRRSLSNGQGQYFEQFSGPMRGRLVETCRDGSRSQSLAECAPATQCRVSWRTTTGDGRTYRWNGALALGEAGQAVAADGRTLRVLCDGGTIRAAPQCVAGQEVVRRRTWELATYRYAGPPADPGELVRADQVKRLDTRTDPPTDLPAQQRYTMSRCGPDGMLQ